MRQIVVQALSAATTPIWEDLSTFFNKTLRVQFGVPVFDIQAGKWTVVPGGDLNFVD